MNSASKTMEGPVTVRPATPDDAAAMVHFIDIAAEGFVHLLWQGMAEPGETSNDVGIRRARRDEGGFSWRNTTMLDHAGEAVGCMIGYPLADEPEPFDETGLPEMVVPLMRLEAKVPGTWYLNVLAVADGWRNLGLGARLIEVAADKARDTGRRGVSLIASDGNRAALRFYARCGFEEIASEPMTGGFSKGGTRWILFARP